MNKAYLGDNVYVEFYAELGAGLIVLTTKDGYHTTNTIYLAPSVYAALTGFVNQIHQQQSLTPSTNVE